MPNFVAVVLGVHSERVCVKESYSTNLTTNPQ